MNKCYSVGELSVNKCYSVGELSVNKCYSVGGTSGVWTDVLMWEGLECVFVYN